MNAPKYFLKIHAVTDKSVFSDGYILRGKDPEPEWTRLDEQHASWKEYMGGLLTFAPLTNPRTILELGAGTGAWATEAAMLYPNAAVTAVDIIVPDRQYPSNMTFLNADLTRPLPFEKELFDVVHIRLVLVHLPHPKALLERMLRLTRPGGWFLVEDVSHNPVSGAGKAEMDTLIDAWREHAVGKNNQDDEIGSKLSGYVRESGLYDIVEEKVVVVTRGKAVDDPVRQRFGERQRGRLTAGTPTFRQNLIAAGKIVPEVNYDDLWDEADGSAFETIHFVWAHRKI